MLKSGITGDVVPDIRFEPSFISDSAKRADVMGSYVRDIAELYPLRDASEAAGLGTRLRGRAGELDIDAVDAVRDLRERR